MSARKKALTWLVAIAAWIYDFQSWFHFIPAIHIHVPGAAMPSIGWFELFGGKAGIACWIWLGVLSFLMLCAWAVALDRDENPPPAVELARLAKVDPAAEVEWSGWESVR
jgi:hypothetical protein